MTEASITAAVVAAINARLPAHVRAYALEDVPASLPGAYVEVSTARRYVGDGHRGDGSVSRRGYRILTRRVVKDAGDGDTLSQRITDALEFATLTAGGQDTVVEFETGDHLAPDDGWYSAADYWTCSLPITNPK